GPASPSAPQFAAAWLLDHRFRQKRRCKGVQNSSISLNGLAIHVAYAYALSRMSAWGQTANCLTTEPWSAVGWIADTQASRASFPSELCLLIPLITAAVPSRAIPCSAAPQQRHKIVQNRLALVGEESVSGVTAEPPPGQTGHPLMRIYIIVSDGCPLCRKAPATVNDGEIAVGSNEELHAAPLSAKRLLALWNALPGVD